ncbi:MAG: excinuclease ABC subunit UvrA [Chloroflexota bacterium]|nr:excinuclease ABC subunit UvrA [Chloroflexota bacterium]MDQ5865945.1 excinuclease ABC subunit UvrA [Chloroflexota bacterium]
MSDTITIRGARLHNLKNITLSIPKNKLVVLTGLSGSGKSTLAFDTLHQEAIRQYLESVGMVTYQQKPSVERIEGLSPSISIDQHLTNHSPRSTVGTVTEVFTYLRILFARVGQQPCPACGQGVPPSHNVTGLELLEEDSADDPSAAAENTYPCPHCGAGVPELGMAHFSFNKPEGACPNCTGLGVVYAANLSLLIDPARNIPDGGVIRWVSPEIKRHLETLQLAAGHFGLAFDPATPIGEFREAQRDLLLYGSHSTQFRRHYPHIEPPQNVNQGRFEGVVTTLMRRYQEHAQDADYRERMEQLLVTQTCPDCRGTRLRPQSRRVTVAGLSIIDVSQMPFTALQTWVERLPGAVPAEERDIIQPIIDDLGERIRRLVNVGAGYLNMARSSPTLSAGEAQRLRLAALLGSSLTGVMYVFDEPTVGLHQRDTSQLIDVLRRLRDLGNTVLVVEHDLDVIRAADHVIDFGPGAGQHGGRIVAEGAPGEIAAYTASVTGDYLAGRATLPGSRLRRGNGKRLVIRGAREHNLKNISVGIPLGTLTVVSGVSGSGKSSLMLDILDRGARQHFNNATEAPGEHDGIDGWEHLDKIISIDQAAITRTSRSNAATYTDAFTPIRQIFAETPEARRRNLNPGHFSFNVPGGHCERCKGAGTLTVNMHFLPDVQVRCPSCRGRRFKPEVLAVSYRGYDIAGILDLTIDEAMPVFQDVPAVASRLSLMSEVGLGYLQLGQPANTLSGGEAQRIKLAKELARRTTGRTLYLLDEPTTGLHPADVARLLALLQRLVDGGNTVVIIEHHIGVIAAADWIIDLGPEGGEAGGYVVAEGTPEDIAQVPESFTGRFLHPALAGVTI